MSLFTLQGCGGVVGSSTVPTATGTSTGNATAALKQSRIGYVWLTKDQTLRPVLGVMGAAYLAESVTAGGSYISGAASSVSQVALLIAQGGALSRLSLADGTITSGANVTGSAIRFSPSGTAAIVFAPGGTSATLITGLRSTMQQRQLSGDVVFADAAVSDAGSVAALATSQGRSAINVLRADGSFARVASLQGAGAVTFVGTGDDLLAVDAAANTMTLIHSASTAPSPVQIGTSNLLKTPVAVGAAPTGRWAVAVNSGESSVIRVDLSGQVAPQRLLCPVQPVVAEPLAYGAFRFSNAGNAPAWVADITASNPTLFFVPALPPSAAPGV